MINYHLNRSFKRFPSHYFYMIALVSTGLFWGHTTTVVKASTPENSTPSTDTTSSVDQTAPSTVLRTSTTTEASSTEQNTDGINNNQVIADSSSSNESNPASDVAGADPVATTTDADDPSSTGTSSGTTSTASVTLTPPDATLPVSDGSQTVPNTDQTNPPVGNPTNPVVTAQTPITYSTTPSNVQWFSASMLGIQPVSSITLNVPVPTNGTNAITASTDYYYTIAGDYNITYQLANYHGSLRNVSITPGTWQGSAYAYSIPSNAVGIDPKTGKNYIDEWMPDIWFQYLLWLSQYSTQFPTWNGFRNTFSKSSLSNLTNFTVTTASQQTSSTNYAPTPIYRALEQTQTLEGLQYAQNLDTINLTLNYNVSDYLYGGDAQSRLWDISSLAKIPSLTSVRFLWTSVQDISALRSNPNLKNVELSFNQISDISGFSVPWTQIQDPSNPNNRIGSSRYNGISLPLLVLKPGTTSVEVSYNVRSYDNSLGHMIPSDGSDFRTDYPEVYEAYKASTADAVNENDHTIVFSNLQTPPSDSVGWLSAGHTFYMDGKDDNTAFDVWVAIPYIISDDYGTTNVNYESLLPSNEQAQLAYSTPLSGEIGSTYNITTNPNTTYPFEWLLDSYGNDYLVLDGTGNYSDYVANNGLAKAVPLTGTYTSDPQNITVLFVVPQPLNIQRGYYDANNTFVPLATNTTFAQSTTADTSLADQEAPIANYHYTSAEIVAADGTTTPLSDTNTVPYLTNGYQLRLLYVPDPATISFTYKDDLGNILPQSGSDTGTAVSTFSPDSKLGQIDISDYTFDHYETSDGTPITTSMTYSELQAGLTLVYKGNTLPVTVSYVDNHGNVIHITAQASGAVNAKLTSDWLSDNQLSIPDYTFDHVETTAGHQTISADATINTVRKGITYVYAPNSITIPIHYLNSNVNPVSIAADDSLDSPINENVTTEQITAKEVAIKYYTFKEARDSAGNLITFPSSTANIREGINLIYDENQVSVPISYVDPDGNPLLTAGSIDGLAAHQLTPDQIATITGYTWKQLINQDKNPVTLPISFGDLVGKQLTAVYEPIQVAIPVDIVNFAGTHLADFPTITGNYLDELTANMVRGMAPSINGYSYSTVQDAAGNVLTLPTQLGAINPKGIKLVYSENNVLLAVHYVDPDGNPLGKDASINGSFTQALFRNDLPIPEFTGYTADTITDSSGNAIAFPTTFGAVNGNIRITYQPVRVTIPAQIVDATDKPIGNLNPIQITGNYLDQLTDAQIRETIPSINGYTYSKVEDSAGNPLTLPATLGKIGSAGIKLVYNENDVLLTVHYVDPADNALSESLPVSGKFNAELNLESLQTPAITGYTAGPITDETGHPITLPTTFGAVNGDILVHYQPVQVTIPVQYVDTNNNTIAEPQQATGNFLDQLTADQITNLATPISGYTFVEAQNSSGQTLNLPVQFGTIIATEINLVYRENTVSAPIQYVDLNGEELLPSAMINHQPSQQLTADELTLPTIPGYTLDHFVDNAQQPITLPITFSEIIDNGIQAVYEPIQVTIPVQYVDDENNPIAESTQISANYLDELTSESITQLATPIDGYTFDTVRDAHGNVLTLPIQFGAIDPAGIKLLYTEEIEGTVTTPVPVTYVDSTGNQLLPAINIEMESDQQITADRVPIPDVPGYQFAKLTDHAGNTVTLPTTLDTVETGLQVVYQPIQVSLPVSYVDTEGRVIANQQRTSGNYLDQLTTGTVAELATPIDGYTFVEAQDATGKPLSLPLTLGTLTEGIKLVYRVNEVPTDITVTINYVDPAGNHIQPPTNIHGDPDDLLTAEQVNVPELPGYVFDHFEDNNGNPFSLPISFSDLENGGLHVVYQPIKVTVPVYYLDDSGQTIATVQQVPGNYQDPFTAINLTRLQQTIPGYQFSNVRTASGETLALPTVLGELQSGIYLIYTADNTNVIVPKNPDVTPPVGQPGDIIPEKIPPKIIYAMKEISLHSSVNFTNDNIVMTYVKKPRIYRPRFMVIDTVRDSQNHLRYLVRDINSKSDTYGLMGYITADPEDVRSAYYHIVPATITVINPKGINGYKNTDLTGKVTHYRQGTVLKVARILKDKTATRFVLTNDQIVTASKLLVKMGTIPQPKRATKLKALNRYGDLGLTTKLEHFKKVMPKSFSILNWDYSDGYNYHVKSLKRYRIDNGYITAYSKLVKSDY